MAVHGRNIFFVVHFRQYKLIHLNSSRERKRLCVVVNQNIRRAVKKKNRSCYRHGIQYVLWQTMEKRRIRAIKHGDGSSQYLLPLRGCSALLVEACHLQLQQGSPPTVTQNLQGRIENLQVEPLGPGIMKESTLYLYLYVQKNRERGGNSVSDETYTYLYQIRQRFAATEERDEDTTTMIQPVEWRRRGR